MMRQEAIKQDEKRHRERLTELAENTRPRQALVTDPIDDPKRVSALTLMAQQNLEKRLQLSQELIRIIHHYSAYNGIQALFQMFPSHKDRESILGFKSYDLMHQRYPTKPAKVSYLMELSHCQAQGECTQIDTRIMFDQKDFFIEYLQIRRIAGKVPKDTYLNGTPMAFNWDAVADLAYLEVLELDGLNIEISMDDLQKLPDSVRSIGIFDNVWTTKSGDVDLGLLPRGLEVFAASGCRGMNGTLKFDAPHSKLVEVAVKKANLHLHVDSTTQLPPSLKYVHAPRNTLSSCVRLLKENNVQVT